jgi:TolB protein
LTLATGRALDATGRTADGEWVMATTDDGVTGWAPIARLVIFGVEFLPVKTAPAQPANTTTATTASTALQITGTVTTATEALNIRSGPGTNTSVIGSKAPGAAIKVTGRNASSDWLQIGLASEGEIGWVSASYVRVEGNVALLPVSERTNAAAVTVSTRPRSESISGLTGKLVFQSASGGTIYLYDFVSGALRSLTTGADPALSPDGKTVAFWRQDGGEHGLYLMDIDGAAARRVLTRVEKLRSPTWSPDGRSIAFSHVNGQDICREAGYGICLPDVFPYSSMFPAVHTDKWSLAAVDRDGSRYRDVPAAPGAGSPDWGPAGLVYAAGGIQATQDGGSSDANRALLNEARFRDPVWQPGGDRIAFQSLEKDHWEIFVAGANGENPTALTRPATTLVPKLPQNVAPAWSPDGHSIAFLSNRSGQWAIWVMDANGANQRRLPIETAIDYQNQGEQVLSWRR